MSARAAERPRGIHSTAVQLAIALVLSAVVVRWLVPAWRSRTRAAGAAPVYAVAFSQERPGGLFPIEELLYQVRPRELGLAGWRAGQHADYELRSTSEEAALRAGEVRRDVRVEVLGPSAPTDAYQATFGPAGEGACWLRFRAMQSFRGIPIDVYRLVEPDDLSLDLKRPSFAWIDGYIPLHGSSVAAGGGSRVELREEPGETLEAGGRSLACRRFRMVLPAEDGGEEQLARLWVHPDVLPLGVVRIESARESLVLRSFGEGERPAVPATLAPLVEGRSTLARFCESCHGETCHESIDPPL